MTVDGEPLLGKSPEMVRLAFAIHSGLSHLKLLDVLLHFGQDNVFVAAGFTAGIAGFFSSSCLDANLGSHTFMEMLCVLCEQRGRSGAHHGGMDYPRRALDEFVAGSAFVSIIVFTV